MTYRRRFLARLLLLLALMALTAVVGPHLPSAHAVPGRWVTETVSWSPAPCVILNEPDPTTGRTTTQTGPDCDYGGFTIVRFFAPLGTLAGIDPVMGANTFISCSLADTVTGEVFVTDHGFAGDGHDVTCLRRVDSVSVSI